MPDYDVTTPLDTDYYGVFADIPDEDRAFWDRARQFSLETSDELADAWDKADYPLHLVKRLGELDLLTDGVQGEGLIEAHSVGRRDQPIRPAMRQQQLVSTA